MNRGAADAQSELDVVLKVDAASLARRDEPRLGPWIAQGGEQDVSGMADDEARETWQGVGRLE